MKLIWSTFIVEFSGSLGSSRHVQCNKVFCEAQHVKKILVFLSIVIYLLSPDNLIIAGASSKDISVNSMSECRTCTETNGVIHCSPFKCPDIPPSFEQYARSPQGKEVIVTLSEVRNSKNLPDTIHENEKILKAISLFLQMPGIGDLGDEEMEWLFGYFRGKADWEGGMSVGVAIKRVKENLYLIGVGYAATTQPSSLYIFYDSSYKRIAKGEGGLIPVIDFRLRGDELGVIFCKTLGSTHPETDFLLLRKENGEWLVQRNPLKEREWIVTDKSIKVFAENRYPKIDNKDLIPIQDKSNNDIDSDLKVHHNSEFGYELKYPKDWRFEEDHVKQELSIGLRDSIVIGRLSIQVWDMSVYSYQQLTEPPPGGIDPDTVKVKQITIDGYSAKEISYVAVGDAGSGSRNMKEISILKNSLVYKITCSMDCDQILSSFKFVK